MPLAGVHSVITIAALAAIRKFLKIKFSNRILLLGGILGLLPDVDIPIAIVLNWIFGTSFYFHKTYTHALIIPVLLYLASVVIKKFNEKAAVIILLSAIAWFMHLVLDCTFLFGLPPSMLPGAIGWGFCRESLNVIGIMSMDAIIIAFFILYLAYKNKN